MSVLGTKQVLLAWVAVAVALALVPFQATAEHNLCRLLSSCWLSLLFVLVRGTVSWDRIKKLHLGPIWKRKSSRNRFCLFIWGQGRIFELEKNGRRFRDTVTLTRSWVAIRLNLHWWRWPIIQRQRKKKHIESGLVSQIKKITQKSTKER